MSVDAEKCAKLRASKILIFENSLTTVKVMTKTKVAPFYLGHGVVELCQRCCHLVSRCFLIEDVISEYGNGRK